MKIGILAIADRFLSSRSPGAAETCAGGREASLGGTDCCGYSTYAMVGSVGHLENVG
jgi:hypothetical protein